jgi:phosphoribosylformimino-5-aminoimidazole carboxamide ribotide isomerase
MNVVDAMLEAGVHRVVLGTAAVRDPAFAEEALRTRGERIAIGVDARDGVVRTAGWTLESSVGAVELARRLEACGARLVIYTDIARDGVMEGPNVEGTLEMIRGTGLSVIASGGVATIEDVRQLGSLNEARLEGVIIGKALYEGKFQLEEALAYAR